MRITLVLTILLLSVLPIYAGENGSQTKEEWIALIKKDAKLATLESFLGPPDDKQSFKDLDGPRVRYYWYKKLDIGTTHPDRLIVMASPYKGELIIWSIYDPVAKEAFTFPWAEKSRGVSPK